MRKETITILFALCVSWLPCTLAYRSGAPDQACVSMTPSHGANTASGAAPYTFAVTKTDGSAVTEYSAGDTLRGNIFSPDIFHRTLHCLYGWI